MSSQIDLQIARYLADGWQVVSRTDREVILARGPGVSGWAWRLFLLGPLAFVARPKGRTLRLSIDHRGRLRPANQRHPAARAIFWTVIALIDAWFIWMILSAVGRS